MQFRHFSDTRCSINGGSVRTSRSDTHTLTQNKTKNTIILSPLLISDTSELLSRMHITRASLTPSSRSCPSEALVLGSNAVQHAQSTTQRCPPDKQAPSSSHVFRDPTKLRRRLSAAPMLPLPLNHQTANQALTASTQCRIEITAPHPQTRMPSPTPRSPTFLATPPIQITLPPTRLYSHRIGPTRIQCIVRIKRLIRGCRP